MSKRPHHDPGSFPTLKLSEFAYTGIGNLETAAMQMEAASTPAELADAHAFLSKMRERLAVHISNLETFANAHGAQGIEQTIIVRYK